MDTKLANLLACEIAVAMPLDNVLLDSGRQLLALKPSGAWSAKA